MATGDWTAVIDLCGGNTDNRSDAVQAVMDGIRTSIGHATSADGISWTPDASMILTGDGNILNSVGAPSVILDGTTYKMWYTRTRSDLTPTQWAAKLTDTANINVGMAIDLVDASTTVIGYVESTDGITWTTQTDTVLPGAGGLWNSIGDPCVIKTGDNEYRMWYTRAKSDLLTGDFSTIWDEIKSFDLVSLANSFQGGDLEQFLTDALALDLDTIKGVLDNTGAVVAYASSADGQAWTVEELNNLVGTTGHPWASVAAPTVIQGAGGSFHMWFTEGIDDLAVQDILDIYLGADVIIGYAKTKALISIQVLPASASVAVGKTQQLSATRTYDDTTTANLTAGHQRQLLILLQVSQPVLGQVLSVSLQPTVV